MARFKVQRVRTETVRTLRIEDLTFPVTVRTWRRDDGLYEGIATGDGSVCAEGVSHSGRTTASAISQSTAKTETELLESLASGIFETCVLLGIARQ